MPLRCDSTVVARKLLHLNETLAHLESQDAATLSLAAQSGGIDPLRRAAIERWLQVAIEACVDLAYHVCAASGWSPPDSARQALLSLASHGALDGALAQRLGQAVGLRNLLVHDYADVDFALLCADLPADLRDLRSFAAVAATWL